MENKGAEHALERLSGVKGHPAAKWGVKVQIDHGVDEWEDDLDGTGDLLRATGSFEHHVEAQRMVRVLGDIAHRANAHTIRYSVMEVWEY